MILLDSNIIIYLRNPNFGEHIAAQLQSSRLHTCNVIIAEVLGYQGLKAADKKYFQDLFAAMKNHLFTDVVTKEVIVIRQATTVPLPDAIIAATARANNLTLWTHNIEDFAKIPGLKLFDPLAKR